MEDVKPAANSVEAYLAQLEPGVARVLEDLRQTIRAAAPEATEAMRMGAVTYLQQGNLVAFAAAAKHCSLYVMNPGPITAMSEALRDFQTAATTIRFKPERPLPSQLVEAIVKERLRENRRA